MGLSRRTVLLLGVGTVLTGCSSPSSPASPPLPSSSPSSPSSGSLSSSPSSPSAPSSAAPVLPAVTRWHPSGNDISPACKAAAVRRIEALGNGRGRALQVIDAQYGGILSTTASVLVVTRSWSLREGTVRSGGSTYDVRLSLRAGRWRVTQLSPSRPGPVARHSRAAKRVLTSERITLPPAAHRDVLSGRVHDSVLHAMLALAASYRIGVSVVRSGHPIYVFGTDRLSDHPQGRAFDTWRIDGHPVVDPRTSRRLVVEYMHAAAAAGSYNVGGPYLLGGAPQWFSDNTHHDHVHAGFLT
ncbi:MAG: hypothetical protein ACRDPI_08055 [Nocardioidaceae bacterium]